VNLATVNERVSGMVLEWPRRRFWLVGFAVAFTLLMLLTFAAGWLLFRGIGVWGVNVPVAWGFAIINFVWWIGIAHAGTFISAILFLLHQKWRTSINRFTEAMTLFAVACAGLYPLLHLGRPIYFYWLAPYPDTMGLWPQFRSPLVWDMFAVSTYAIVSLVFWYVGLLPDLATLRDRAQRRWVSRIYGIACLGWRGAGRHWEHYEKLYVILAGLATPLVVSVHSIVGLDFAATLLPGWHSTIFPPYFVGGAIFCGFAMVLVLVIPLRRIYRLEEFITEYHLEMMGLVMLATGWVVAYGYFTEFFTAWWSGDLYDHFTNANRALGPYARSFWAMLLCNVVAPQFLWSKRIRRTIPALFTIALAVNLGMWLERYVIIITSLHRDFLPSSWGMYSPTRWDWMIFLGTGGLFLTLLFLFLRFLPVIAMAELRRQVAEPEAQP
jgi:molybdopterin-containing oxidoreductase family membrane subunit